MSKLGRLVLSAAGILAALALALSCGVAMARYLETFSEDQGFQAKPLDSLEIRQSWVAQEDSHMISFRAGAGADGCRVFLAASQGITAPGELQVELTVGETTIVGVASPIESGSVMEGQFGPGVVFRFYPAEGGEELLWDLSQGKTTVTVRGLESAAEVTSLLRLFVEKAQ